MATATAAEVVAAFTAAENVLALRPQKVISTLEAAGVEVKSLDE